MHLGELAMHQGWRPHHAAAIDLADGLVAETDAEDRHLWPGAGDQLKADAGPIRVARARRQHDGLRRLGQHLIHGDLVVAVDTRRRAQFPKEMNEVVGKAVVIVDQRQHRRRVTPEPRAPSSFQLCLTSLGVRNSSSLPLLMATSFQAPAGKRRTTSPAVGYLASSRSLRCCAPEPIRSRANSWISGLCPTSRTWPTPGPTSCRMPSISAGVP